MMKRARNVFGWFGSGVAAMALALGVMSMMPEAVLGVEAQVCPSAAGPGDVCAGCLVAGDTCNFGSKLCGVTVNSCCHCPGLNS